MGKFVNPLLETSINTEPDGELDDSILTEGQGEQYIEAMNGSYPQNVLQKMHSEDSNNSKFSLKNSAKSSEEQD